MSPNVTGQLLELHRAGKIRILSVNGAERLKAAPDIPTAIEQGVPGMIGLLAIGLFAPAATPQPIVDQIARSEPPAMADPEFQKVFDKAGLESVADSEHREDPPLPPGGSDALGPGGEGAEPQQVAGRSRNESGALPSPLWGGVGGGAFLSLNARAKRPHPACRASRDRRPSPQGGG